MSVETWLAFVVASVAVLAIPGPVVALTVSRVAERGWVAAVPLAVGATLGDGIAMTLSLAGAGAVLTASADAFAALKLLGSGYLVWLGLGALTKQPSVASAATDTSFRDAVLVTGLHPSGLVFFVAFVPLFIDPVHAVVPQILVLEGTFLTLTAANIFFWAGLTSGGRRIATGTLFEKRLEQSGGAIMIGIGAMGGIHTIWQRFR